MNKRISKYSLPVLLYHRIVNEQSVIGKHKIYVRERDFEKQMLYLKNNGYETITFYDLQQQPSLDLKKKVILTFDDGYKDNYKLMFPILRKYEFKAVVFLVTQTDHNEWGMAEGEPRVDLMTPGQIKEMSDYGIEMGGHTQVHKDLVKCSPKECLLELKGSKEDVGKLTNRNAISFSYPFGAINDSVKQAVREAGYTYAVSTNTGPKEFGDDFFQIRRIEISPRTTLRSFKKKVSGTHFYPSFFKALFNHPKTK